MLFRQRTLLKFVLCGSAALAFYASGPLAVSAQSAAATEVRIQELEQEIRRLNGVVEEQNYEINGLKAQVDRLVSDLTLRIRALEGGGSVASSSGGAPLDSGYDPYGSQAQQPTVDGSLTQSEPRPPNSSFNYVPPDNYASGSPSSGGAGQEVASTATGTGSVPLPADTPLVAYESAFALLKKSDFNGAEVQFASFLKKFPDSNLTANAKYWYGETFYVRGQYEKAARIFAEGYQDNPTGGKAADNLLKLGLSLAGQKKKDDACIALKKLEEDFSNTSGPIIRRAKQEMNTLGC